MLGAGYEVPKTAILVANSEGVLSHISITPGGRNATHYQLQRMVMIPG